MQNQSCYFVSYRNIPVAKYLEIQRDLMFQLIELIHKGVRYFYVRDMPGFDVMAALTVLNLKKRFPHIRLILIPLDDGLPDYRCEDDKKIRDHILAQADMVAYISEEQYVSCMRDNEGYFCYLPITGYTLLPKVVLTKVAAMR